MFNEKRKSMLEEGVIFSGGGAILGLLVDKITQSGDYSTTRNGALIGAMIGIGVTAFSNAFEGSVAKINERLKCINSIKDIERIVKDADDIGIFFK